MSIVSWYFPFFIACFFCVYFLIPKKYQWYLLLAGNLVFYLFAGVKGFAIALASAFFAYLVSLKLEHDRQNDANKKGNIPLCTAVIIVIVAWWLFLKFMGPSFGLIMPLGISFYSLNLIAYLSDVHRLKYPAEKNFLRFLTYLLYFPQIIQGPFTRYPAMKEQLFAEHSFSYERFAEGSLRALYGLTVKKLIIADFLAVIVNRCLASYESYSGWSILLCLILYSIELYADFSGYMDIVNGISHVLGIEMPENFTRPYFSSSLDEFWRRWHITLGAWFREYVFFPVSMNKKVQQFSKSIRKKYGSKFGKLIAADIALFFVWTATGLWHDFSWSYLLWGYLNMLVIMGSMHLEDTYKNLKQKLKIDDTRFAYRLFKIVRTFLLVCLIRVAAISGSLTKTFALYRQLFVAEGTEKLFAETGTISLIILVAAIVSMLLIDLLEEHEKWQEIKENCPVLVRDLAVSLMIICFILFVGGNNDLLGGFMYARF